MAKIKKLNIESISSAQTTIALINRINEIIDLINEIDERTSNTVGLNFELENFDLESFKKALKKNDEEIKKLLGLTK